MVKHPIDYSVDSGEQDVCDGGDTYRTLNREDLALVQCTNLGHGSKHAC